MSKWCHMKLISAGSKLRIAGPLAAERPGHHRDANPGREVASFLEQGSHVIWLAAAAVWRWASGAMRFTGLGIVWISFSSHLIDDASGMTWHVVPQVLSYIESFTATQIIIRIISKPSATWGYKLLDLFWHCPTFESVTKWRSEPYLTDDSSYWLLLYTVL